MALAALPLAACGPSANPHAVDACVAPGDALVARALFDQARGALAHSDARTAAASLEAGLAKIGHPDMAEPTLPLDDSGQKIEGVRATGDTGKLVGVEQRVLAERLSDYERYCGH